MANRLRNESQSSLKRVLVSELDEVYFDKKVLEESQSSLKRVLVSEKALSGRHGGCRPSLSQSSLKRVLVSEI